jgi:endonuclease G
MRPDFNAGIWNRLEIQVRKWAGKYDTVYVITGGVLTKGLPSIGYEAVSVPEAFYKIVVRGGRESLETIAFLIPHRETKRNLEDFRVTVDELETETGIDFFRQLEDEEEVRIEKDKDSRWPY